MTNDIIIKSSRYGVNLILNDKTPFPELVSQVGEKFKGTEKFFGNAKMAVSFEGRQLSEKEEKELIDAIMENSSIQIVCIMNHDPQMEEAMRQRVELALSGKGREGSSGPAGNAESFAAQSGPESDFYKGNLRSGQVLESASNVTLIGDVNPGARIVSQGNIVVLGSLRGNAWAGAGGDSRCFIFALDMKPIQLQIGDYIAKSPDREREKKRLFGKGRSEEAEMPRVALVREGNICIEPMTKGCLDQI
ncbi:MAG TPA: septum site-determining protein MinC [Candidatus Eisenbergiella stercorigallinarum]|uniref:Probable septum site-determining protein MinC n=1 Tax=Candidatus Eisenbergiella stercorigallinarum TaxID=2838557 RepID=A0A9D2QYA9_9FIRM|nr:septum site-determining protein MinC [Candidatus Eisenbergiella stercorigallinarum]